jgi:hypothetical protein
MSFEELKTRVDMDRIPSWVISHGLHTYRQDLPTWEGGELVDSYLASLSPYADLTYVDKRTKENFNRASGRSLPFRRLVRRVEKCGSYLDVLKDMSRDGKAR